jgi:predicted transcriptional regulator
MRREPGPVVGDLDTGHHYGRPWTYTERWIMRMRATKNASITMPAAVVKDAERLAKRENRTMSELVREALRHYATSRRTRSDRGDLRWMARTIGEAKRNPLAPKEILAEDKRLATYGARQAKKVGFKERDTVRMIHESRARRNAS